jgi:SAM-dependent methyltransferase/peroxiredoxin
LAVSLILGALAFAQGNPGLKEGDLAPAFVITTDRGSQISPDSFGGDLLVLNFWETACLPCVKELPSLSRFARDFRSSHVVVVAVGADDDERKYHAFLREHRVGLETYRDPSRRISHSFGTEMFPETYLIQNSRIIRKVIGPIDWAGNKITAFVRVHATRRLLPPVDTYEGERKAYDEIYSNADGLFSREPNAFMLRMIAGRKPGHALDVGMGQGRNALWLAAQGWAVTGFDISPAGIEIARRAAEQRGLRIETFVTSFEDFDWGKEKWDLILFSYFFPQSALPKVWDALKPGGVILVEGFHIDTARQRPLGGGYRNNELFQLLKDYRVLTYEDVEARQEWGLPYGNTNRLVRVLAEKSVPLRAGCTWSGRNYGPGDFMCWGVSRWNCGPEGWQSAGKCGQ